MDGYFVITKPLDDTKAKKLIRKMRDAGLVDLRDTRNFNSVTGGIYKSSAKAAVTRALVRKPDQVEKRRAYNQREDVKKRNREYAAREDVKQRKKFQAQIKKEVLKRAKDIELQVIKEKQQEEMTVDK